MSISTHVLDAVTGRPAEGLRIRLLSRDGAGWTPLADRRTDADGRIADLAPTAAPGVYRLHFDVEGYAGADCFYPEVVITFRVADAAAHHHVPLLLSPFAYSTYRGS